jgi:hypothetical protein
MRYAAILFIAVFTLWPIQAVAQTDYTPTGCVFFDPAVRTGFRERPTAHLGGGIEVPVYRTAHIAHEMGYLFVGGGNVGRSLTVASVNTTYRMHGGQRSDHEDGLFVTGGYTRSLSGRTFNAVNFGVGVNFPTSRDQFIRTLRFECRAYYELGGNYSFRGFRFGY